MDTQTFKDSESCDSRHWFIVFYVSRKPTIFEVKQKNTTKHIKCTEVYSELFLFKSAINVPLKPSVYANRNPYHNICSTKHVRWSHYGPSVTQRVGRGIALLFHGHGTRRGRVVSSTPRPHFTPQERPGIHFTGGWVGPGPVWTGRKSHPQQDPILDCPAHSQSLYRLSYPATNICSITPNKPKQTHYWNYKQSDNNRTTCLQGTQWVYFWAMLCRSLSVCVTTGYQY
jgi:hypothetical protein